MKFGISFANVGTFVKGKGAARLAQAAEEAGFDSLWTVEHILYPEGYESTYPYGPTGRCPARATIRYRTRSCGSATRPRSLPASGWPPASRSPERHPLTFAKEVATLDVLSGGRVTLGVGIGWLREEFDALDVPWERRGPRTRSTWRSCAGCGPKTT